MGPGPEDVAVGGTTAMPVQLVTIRIEVHVLAVRGGADQERRHNREKQ
jgi:hypothetical protein